jgi:hypothetical protein
MAGSSQEHSLMPTDEYLESPRAIVCDTEALFHQYHAGWEARNPYQIASRHTEDTIFHVHDGSAPVEGRNALQAHCDELFNRYEFDFEVGRTFYGQAYWIFEWRMLLRLQDPNRNAFVARIEMLDVVTFNEFGLVTRKDVYMNGEQAKAAFERAELGS